MIDIELNGGWAITADSKQYILGKKHKVDNDQGCVLRNRTYHRTVDGALKFYFGQSLRTTGEEVKTFEQLVELKQAQQKELEKIRKGMELT
jgi:hypothetical protein